MYRRLIMGRTQFEEVLANILNSLMQISSLDLSLNHYSEILISDLEHIKKLSIGASDS